MKKLFVFLVMTLLWIPLKAQTIAENNSSESLTTFKTENEDFQDSYSDDLPWHARRFKVTAGAFFPVNNTEVEVGSNNGSFGNLIDFEKDLGFNKSSVSFMGTFEWRISRRSRLGAEYYYLSRSATKTLQKEIEFGENVYPVNATVSAFMDNHIGRITYGYAFISKPKYEIGALIGAHVLFGDVGMRLEGATIETEYKDNFDFTAPLPDIGFWGEFVLGRKVGLYANINYFAIKINDFDGRLLSYNLSVLYNVYQNFSLTAGYTGLNIRVDVEKERLNGFFKWGYNGPTITATYSFGNHVKLYKH
ncbi:hypothetical protein [Flavobacterium sp. S87F.05.LMB.W.Kidney.N]|jgi:hypothetical protein|uniref:hypothetical protein n=1 Tax=Flavobacterium sp. S87F.05.LMB.W.Kidney.N TaxID=1278758 RepID=UPI001064C9A6|nr:hypothetical protein [Flavobacterium sp. S87F.05.LMB.W.Kidney.N]TDX09684.1 hypothetical protein EDB96_3270 [Flavobacterium sp. S87F.05.LMB.W.Kidney.N]